MRFRRAPFAAALLAGPLTLTAALCSATPVQAQPVQGLYIGGGVGVNLLQDEKFAPSSSLGTGTVKLRPDTGLGVVGSIGYGLGNGIRIELEGNYRDNPLHGAATGFPLSVHGSLRSSGLMANALYDLDIGQGWVYPYVGAGIGYAWNDLHNVSISNAAVPFGVASNSRSGGVAYQGIAGLAFPLSLVNGLSVTTEYRFFSSISPQSYSATSVTPSGTGAGTFESKHDTINHSILIGLRYAFNAAPPAPMTAQATTSTAVAMAAPTPAPARTYLVFFDWDRADLTARAHQIIKDAAAASTHTQLVKIEVDGNADLSGTPQYNQGLSLRRAQVVTAELVADGVSENLIEQHAYGDTKPLVPTARGVREPQNRRVEIIFR